jgi:hypothetical protein
MNVTRVSTLDDLGDLLAPKGSSAWAVAVRDELQRALKDTEFNATTARGWQDDFRKHDGW